jgi:hypothetical protein
MRFKFVTAALAAAVSISLLGAPGASAATEFGDNCAGNAFSGEPVTYFALTAIGRPVLLTSPASGVITKWKSTIASVGSFPHSVRVLRPNGPKTVQVVAEASGVLNTGANALDARLPVQTGDRLALFGTGPSGTAFCDFPGPVDTFGAFFGGGTGQTVEFVEVSDEAGIPVAAIIEADADNDGFGDETQDQCPQSAAAQTACPPVALSTSKQIRKGSVTVIVTPSTAAPVTVKGVAKLGKGKKAKLNGGTKNLTPGVLGKFTLKFTKALKAKLKELSSKKSLTLSVTVTGTNVAGAVTTKTLKARLKGQAKP